MSEQLLREWIYTTLLAEQARGSWAQTGRDIMTDIANISGVGISASDVQKGGYDKKRKSIRVIVPGLQPGPNTLQHLQKMGAQITAGLVAVGYTDRDRGYPAKIKSSVSGRYPSISLVDPDGTNFFIVLNPGFRLGGAAGNAGPGETELEEIADEPLFQQWASSTGMTFNFDNISIPGVIGVSKPSDKKGMGGEPKSDIDLVTVNGSIRLSLKGPTYPTYEGISEARLKHYPGFPDIAKCAKELLAVKLLTDPTTVKKQISPGVFEVKRDKEYHYDLPQAQQLHAIYGIAATGGPVDYVVTADGVVEYVIPDPAQPVVNWDGFAISAKRPDSSFPGEFPAIPKNGTPVLAFRTAADRGFEVELQGTQGLVTVRIPGTRPTILPTEQRRSFENAGRADVCPPQPDVDEAIRLIEIDTAPPGEVPTGENIQDGLIKQFVRSALLTEALSKSDKKDIERMIRKQIKSNERSDRDVQKLAEKVAAEAIKDALGVSYFGNPGKINKFVLKSIHEEVNDWLGDKKTQNEIATITKTVVKKLYRELSFASPQIIDRIKV